MKKYNKENLEEIIKISLNKTDVIKKLGNKISGGNFNTLTKYIKKYDIDISHFEKNNKAINRKNIKKNSKKIIPIENILIMFSTYNSTHLKNRLYNEGLKERFCEMCGQDETWNNEKISLILDHINGDHFDNRIENLRILCPNCNATLPTHCKGKRGLEATRKEKKEKREKKKHYCSCGEEIRTNKKGANCIKCYNIKRRKIKNRPSTEQLMKDIEKTNYTQTGKKYGVSDNTIRKWLK